MSHHLEQALPIAPASTQAPYRLPALSWKAAPLLAKPKIGLVGAGCVAGHHLAAYRALGLEVAAIADSDLPAAESRRDAYFPRADAVAEAAAIFERDDIEIVDLATHPGPRVALMEQAIECGKHVLSQKPFVCDLDIGERLVRLAKAKGVVLAVNQNARWAPFYRYVLETVRSGLLGRIGSIDCVQQWDHSWSIGTAFDEMHHLLLYDFGIHWFDFIHAYTGAETPERIFASVRHTSYQQAKPPYLASVIVDYPRAQARINYNADVRRGQEYRLIVCGEKGTIRSVGSGFNRQEIQLETDDVQARATLAGEWYDEGFRGTMVELINAIAEGRPPENNASDNLQSLALCFAALESANTGLPQQPGKVRKMPATSPAALPTSDG